MSELEIIYVTSGLTIIGGVLVFVIGKLIDELIIKHFIEYRNIVGKIDRDLVLYSYIYMNPNQVMVKEKSYQTCHEELRKDSCDLRVKHKQICWYRYLLDKKYVINNNELEKVASNLIGISNCLSDLECVKHNEKRSREIREILKLN